MTARKDGRFFYIMQIDEQLKEILKTIDKTEATRVHLIFSIKDNDIIDVTRLNPLLSDPNFILVETDIHHQGSLSIKAISALHEKLKSLCIEKADLVTKHRLSLLDGWAQQRMASK